MIRNEWYADGQRIVLVEVWRDSSGTARYRRTEGGTVTDEREAAGDEVDELEAAERAAEFVPVEDRVGALESNVGMVPGWAPGEAVEVGDRRAHSGWVWSCQQAHTTQSDWTPPETPALWGRVQAAMPDVAERISALLDLQVSNRDAQAIIDVLTGRV